MRKLPIRRLMNAELIRLRALLIAVIKWLFTKPLLTDYSYIEIFDVTCVSNNKESFDALSAAAKLGSAAVRQAKTTNFA